MIKTGSNFFIFKCFNLSVGSWQFAVAVGSAAADLRQY